MTIEKFAQEIMEYESDTFSATGSEITQKEAKKVAEYLLGFWVNTKLDGVLIDQALDVVKA